MRSMENWKKFKATGNINDYLNFANEIDGKTKVSEKKKESLKEKGECSLKQMH